MKEVSRYEKYSELHENANTANQQFWDVGKAVQGKCVALKAQIKKRKKKQI